jgi:hypothetical protein
VELVTTFLGEQVKYPNKRFNDKPCKCCGEIFTPDSPSRMYCTPLCSTKGYDNAYYLREYGATYKVVQKLREEQDNKCYLCGSEGFLMRTHHRQKLVVDHDHSTGQVRKLLCHNCNRALGLFLDNPDVMVKAAAYVKEHKEGATTIPKGSRG